MANSTSVLGVNGSIGGFHPFGAGSSPAECSMDLNAQGAGDHSAPGRKMRGTCGISIKVVRYFAKVKG